jgi:pimeloyl-ACP methyl ester carboxylesterase
VTALAYEGRGTRGPALLLVHGFGDSPAGGDVATMDALADAALAVADALGFERLVLGGLSMGGYVALSAARRHAARLDGLILLDTRAEGDTPEAREGRRADAARVVAEGIGFYVEKSRALWLSPATLDGRPELVPQVDAMASGASREGVAAALRGMAERRDARPDLAAIAAPTLVVCGREDRITPPAAMRELAAAIPGARFAEVAGGHMAPFEHPAEVAAELASFLEALR